MKVVLHEMSWIEGQRYFKENEIAIFRVSSNEEYGPQIPLGIDDMIAEVAVQETSRRTGVLCLQVIPFEVSCQWTG